MKLREEVAEPEAEPVVTTQKTVSPPLLTCCCVGVRYSSADLPSASLPSFPPCHCGSWVQEKTAPTTKGAPPAKKGAVKQQKSEEAEEEESRPVRECFVV